MTAKTVAALALIATLPVVGCGRGITEAPPRPPVEAGPQTEPGQLTVTGLATLEVAPDVADVVFTLSVDAAKPKAAVAQLRPRQADLLRRLTDVGITDDSLRMSTLAVHPLVEYVGGRELIRGYRSTLVVTASTEDFAAIPDLMEAGATAGASSMRTSFRNTQMPELKKKVRDMAVAAAMAKAEQMAGMVGVQTRRVLEMSEIPSGQAWAIYGGVANAVANADPSARPGLNPDVLPLTLSVTLKYELGSTTAEG